jgi:hypothetical protein
MNSDWDKSYAIIVDLIWGYNFVVHTLFFIWNYFDAQIIDTIFKSKIWRIFLLSTTYLKKLIMFSYNSDGGKLYTKIVYLNDIYNLVVQIVSIWIHFCAQMIDTMFTFKIQILDLDSI